MLLCVTIFPVPPRRVRLCVVCGAALEKPSRGRMPRFCGVACRMAAYRRRQQGVTEKLPRWERPRGRLRLSRLLAMEREQLARSRAMSEDLDTPIDRGSSGPARYFGTPVLLAPGEDHRGQFPSRRPRGSGPPSTLVRTQQATVSVRVAVADRARHQRRARGPDAQVAAPGPSPSGILGARATSPPGLARHRVTPTS